MRKKKLITALISLLTVILMTATLTATVFATEEYIPDTPPVEEVTDGYEPEEPEYQPETEYIPEETEAAIETEPVEEEEVTEEETQESEEDKPLFDLPEVESHEVIIPTTVKLPDIEVSDTSLMGGVIAWLCVALGIAVIAGVLVSQRTRQVPTGSSKSDRRR